MINTSHIIHKKNCNATLSNKKFNENKQKRSIAASDFELNYNPALATNFSSIGNAWNPIV